MGSIEVVRQLKRRCADHKIWHRQDKHMNCVFPADFHDVLANTRFGVWQQIIDRVLAANGIWRAETKLECI